MCVSWAITLVIPKPGPDGAAPNLLTEHELTWYSKNRVWLAFASAWQVWFQLAEMPRKHSCQAEASGDTEGWWGLS